MIDGIFWEIYETPVPGKDYTRCIAADGTLQPAEVATYRAKDDAAALVEAQRRAGLYEALLGPADKQRYFTVVGPIELPVTTFHGLKLG